jgi:hypothetical protein
MLRVIYAAVLAAVVSVAGLGVLTTQASAAVPATAVAKCTKARKSVNCGSVNQAYNYLRKHCAGRANNFACPGVGRHCVLQDDGIICASAWGRHHRRHHHHPKGGVAAGAGGTAAAKSLPLILGGLTLAGLGIVVLRRRRAGQSSRS